MNYKKLVFVFLCQLAGTLFIGSGSWAAEKDHRTFRNMQPDPRRTMQQFRQERAQNPQQFRAPRVDQRARVPAPPGPPNPVPDRGMSRDEAARAMPRASKHFDEMDLDRDGTVSREEIRAFREKRRQERWGAGDPRN